VAQPGFLIFLWGWGLRGEVDPSKRGTVVLCKQTLSILYLAVLFCSPAVVDPRVGHTTQGGNVTSAGWQVTLCDPIWQVSSRSGVATLRTAAHLLLTYRLTYHGHSLLSPFISVLCHSDWLFHGESCPRLDVVHPGRAWFSLPLCTWHSPVHYLFLRATLLCA